MRSSSIRYTVNGSDTDQPLAPNSVTNEMKVVCLRDVLPGDIKGLTPDRFGLVA
ncbi:MAG: hypothetical protein V3W34_06055 [Phycisphaerae bacterium]